MHPVETIYQLAGTSGDYRECHHLLRTEGMEDSIFRFPTVIARRNGVPIGCVGTQDRNDMVVCGPLVIKGGNKPIVAMRLLEAYDLLMQLHGIKLYYFSVAADRTDAFSRKKLEGIGMEYWETVGDYIWFKRRLS